MELHHSKLLVIYEITPFQVLDGAKVLKYYWKNKCFCLKVGWKYEIWTKISHLLYKRGVKTWALDKNCHLTIKESLPIFFDCKYFWLRSLLIRDATLVVRTTYSIQVSGFVINISIIPWLRSLLFFWWFFSKICCSRSYLANKLWEKETTAAQSCTTARKSFHPRSLSLKNEEWLALQSQCDILPRTCLVKPVNIVKSTLPQLGEYCACYQ